MGQEIKTTATTLLNNFHNKMSMHFSYIGRNEFERTYFIYYKGALRECRIFKLENFIRTNRFKKKFIHQILHIHIIGLGNIALPILVGINKPNRFKLWFSKEDFCKRTKNYLNYKLESRYYFLIDGIDEGQIEKINHTHTFKFEERIYSAPLYWCDTPDEIQTYQVNMDFLKQVYEEY